VTVTEVRHRLEYGLVLAMRSGVALLPASWCDLLGAAIGWFFYVVDGGHRRLAARQLQHAFPIRTAAECRAIARATFVHFGRALVNVLRLSTRTPAQILDRVDVEGADRVRQALSHGKGVIIVTAHFGHWELQGIAHALVLPPIGVLARPLDNPYLHRLLETTRQETGNYVIYRQGAVRKVLRALHDNKGVAILIDQHIHGADAVMVNFFNRPAATTTAVAMLALRTGAPVVPAFALPLSGGRCRLVYEPAIEPPSADAEDPVRELTQRCTDVVEMYVRRHPQFWLWMHRRWRDADGAASAVRGMFPAAAADEPERAD
jgi:KDO2-lipid IV(A) lauroyltransferase